MDDEKLIDAYLCGVWNRLPPPRLEFREYLKRSVFRVLARGYLEDAGILVKTDDARTENGER